MRYDAAPTVRTNSSPYDTAYTDPGWTFGVTTTATDYEIKFTRTGAQIASGGFLTLSNAVIRFSTPGSPAGTPFKPFVGAAYAVDAQAEATNTGGPGFLTAAVAEASSGAPANTATELDINSFVASRVASSGVLTVSAVGAGALGLEDHGLG